MDAEQPSHKAVRRPRLAILVGGLAVILMGVAAITIVYDLMRPPTADGSSASREGFQLGFGLGIVLRTLVLGALAMFLWSRALALWSPENHSSAAIARAALVAIAGAERDRAVNEPTEAAGFYSTTSDHDLADVYNRMRPEAAPERFKELILEIRRRVGPAV